MNRTPAGRLTEKWLPNGVTTRYAYNPDNTLVQVANRVNGSVLSQHDYTYDGLGNRQTHLELINGTATPYKYLYDELNRLKEVRNNTTNALIEAYAHDPLGNRTTKTAGATTYYYSYDAANELQDIRTGSPTGTLVTGLVYDANGNLVKKCESGTVTRTDTACTGSTITTLTYNVLNQLAQATKTGLAPETYVYDDQGRRIQKTGSSTTNYLYNGPDITAEYGTGWTSPTALYTHGPNWDDPILRTAGTTTQYYHQDGLGSVVAVTDATGATVGSARYDAWGVKLASTGTIPTYGYTGREPDATGLIYYRARTYDPSTGTFTQPDPLGMVEGVNRRAYVRNNPVNYTDPTGELLINHLTGRLGIPVDDPDRIRMSNFTNAVALTGTSMAAAPFVAGTVGPAASLMPAPSSTVLIPGAIGGVSGALGAWNTGGDVKQVMIGGGVGFGVGVLTSPLPGSSFWANAGKGAFSGFAGSSVSQSIDIGTSPTKTFSQDFNTGQVIGSTIGGFFAGGITAPFGRSTAEQISAAIIGYGPSTAGAAIGEAWGRSAPSSQSLPSFTAPSFFTGGCASIICTTNYTAGGGTSGVSRSK